MQISIVQINAVTTAYFSAPQNTTI